MSVTVSNAYKRGVNVAQADFGAHSSTAVLGTDYVYPSDASLNYLATRGHSIIRLPFLWEHVQHSLSGPLAATEVAEIVRCVNTCNANGQMVILDNHNYGEYNSIAFGATGGPSQDDLLDFWKKLYAALPSGANVALGLMNEPHDLPGTPPTTTSTIKYGWDSGLMGWGPESTTTITTDGTHVHDGANALRVTRQDMTVGGTNQQMRFNLGGDTLVATDGGQISVWVYAPTGNGDVVAHVEMQDSSWAWHAGTETWCNQGSWTKVSFTPDPSVWTGHKAIGVQITSNNPTSTRVDVWVDSFSQDVVANDGVAPYVQWQNISQYVLTGLRSAGINALITVPLYQYSGVWSCNINHPQGPWINDPANNFWYEAHQYPDGDHSGTFQKGTFAQETANRGDILTQEKGYTDGFVTWLNGHQALIGEIGWPADPTGWDTVGSGMLNYYDSKGLYYTYWATGEWWDSSYPMRAYDVVNHVIQNPFSNGVILESHLTTPTTSTTPTTGGGTTTPTTGGGTTTTTPTTGGGGTTTTTPTTGGGTTTTNPPATGGTTTPANPLPNGALTYASAGLVSGTALNDIPGWTDVKTGGTVYVTTQGTYSASRTPLIAGKKVGDTALMVGTTPDNTYYMRKNTVVFYPADYGTMGDGVTDDTKALQACITAAAGHTVILDDQYLVSASIVVPAKTIICGEGTVISGTDTHTFINDPGDNSPASKITIRDITIARSGTTSATTTDCIRMTGGKNHLIDNVTVTGGHVGVTFYNCTFSRMRGCEATGQNGTWVAAGFYTRNNTIAPIGLRVEDCYAHDVTGLGIFIDTEDLDQDVTNADSIVRDCHVENVSDNGIRFQNMAGHSVKGWKAHGNTVINAGVNGIRINSSVIVTDNYIFGSNAGIRDGGASGAGSWASNAVISNNVIIATTNLGAGIQLQAAAQNVTISGNECRGWLYGIYVGEPGTTTGNPNHITITGNNCLQNGRDGIILQGVVHSNLVGNICNDNGRTVQGMAGIRADANTAYVNIVGNMANNTDSQLSQYYGVYLDPNSVRISSEGNNWANNVNPPFYGSQSNPHKRNVDAQPGTALDNDTISWVNVANSTLQNGWVNTSSPLQYISTGGVLKFNGFVQCTSAANLTQTIFQLPQNLWPSKTQTFLVASNQQDVFTLQVGADGNVLITGTYAIGSITDGAQFAISGSVVL